MECFLITVSFWKYRVLSGMKLNSDNILSTLTKSTFAGDSLLNESSGGGFLHEAVNNGHAIVIYFDE